MVADFVNSADDKCGCRCMGGREQANSSRDVLTESHLRRVDPTVQGPPPEFWRGSRRWADSATPCSVVASLLTTMVSSLSNLSTQLTPTSIEAN